MYKVGVIGLAAAMLAWMPLSGPDRDWDSVAGADLVAAAYAELGFAAQQEWDWRGRVERGDAIEIIGITVRSAPSAARAS